MSAKRETRNAKHILTMLLVAGVAMLVTGAAFLVPQGSSSSSSGTPAGSPYQVQYNSNNTFAATEAFQFNAVSNHLVVSNNAAAGGAMLKLAGTSTKVFSMEMETGTNRFRSDAHILFDMGPVGTFTLKTNSFAPPQNNSTQLGSKGTQWSESWGAFFGADATNANPVITKPANSNAVPVTNITGVVEMATATPIFWNANFANSFSISNRVTAATTIVITNTSQEQEIMGRVIGEASGGSARVITVVANLGTLVANLDTYGTALATSAAFTLTNGNAVTFYWTIGKRNGTNVAEFVSRQYAF